MKFQQSNRLKTHTEKSKTRKVVKLFKLALVFSIISWAIFGVYMFLDSYELRTPLIVQTFWVKKQVDMVSPIGSKSAGLIQRANAEELTDEQYIRMKFGNHGDIAVAIAKSESGLRANAVHQNNNGTIDIGCWQVNSLHLSKGVTLETLLNCKRATDWVYDNLYLYQGFAPWVAFTSGSYLAKL